jgi:chromate reductase, NAD(P)H dehydrogenase (quinone)
MNKSPKILAFAGSSRRESYNRRLVPIACDAARKAGAEVTLIELADFPLPLFNEDLEANEGQPALVHQLKQLFIAHHGLLIAAPEYNSSLTPLLKNTLDWVSRPVAGEPPLAAYSGKVAALMSASPGALGGLRGLVHLRSLLGNIGVVVLPDQVAVPRAFEAFAPNGSLVSAQQKEQVEGLGTALATMLIRLNAGG